MPNCTTLRKHSFSMHEEIIQKHPFFTNVERTEISFSFSVYASIDMTTKVVYPKYYNTDIFWQLHSKKKFDSFLTFLINFLVRTLQYTENIFTIFFPHEIIIRIIQQNFRSFQYCPPNQPKKYQEYNMYLSIYDTWDIPITLMTTKNMPHHSCIQWGPETCVTTVPRTFHPICFIFTMHFW